jgi:Spy/CpxP family protein refolding chaperone
MTFRLITIALAATALFAQGPGGPGGPGGFRGHGMSAPAKTNEVQSYLSLTDAQISSLQQLRTAEAAALKPIYQQSGPLRQSLRTQEQGSSADAAEVGKLVLSIRSLEAQAAPIRASYQQQALAVLSADQKTKLAALQSAAALMPAIHEATALNLLTQPRGPGSAGGVATQ